MQDFEQWLEVNQDILSEQFKHNGASKESCFNFIEESRSVFIQCCGNNLKHMGDYSMYFNRNVTILNKNGEK